MTTWIEVDGKKWAKYPRKKKELLCEHGVGHGGIHGCDIQTYTLKELVKMIRDATECEFCGKQPVEFHHPDHPSKPHRRISSLVNRGTFKSVMEELSVCQALCRSCHMQEDGRLKKLQENKPNKKGVVHPPKKCAVCRKLTKPLRKGLCYRCYENHRHGGRSFKGHVYVIGCCDHPSFEKAWKKIFGGKDENKN